MSTPLDASQLRRRRLMLAVPLAACGLVVAPVQAQPGIHQASRNLMGTRLDLTLQDGDGRRLSEAADAAFAEMARLAGMMSRYRQDSVLNAINLAAGLQPVQVPPELMRVLEMAQQAALASGGAFDATVGTLKDWNFDADHPALPTAAQLAAQLPLVGSKGLQLDRRRGTAYLRQRGMRLDLGGIAKLPILQAGLDQLHAHGVRNAMLNGGGDVLVSGKLDDRPWRVGLRDPRRPGQLLGAVELTRGFVAASGDYERYFMYQGKRLHHILDPHTGYPSQGPHGLALVGDDLAAINGLGAAIMVAGAAAGQRRLAKLPGVDAFIVDADRQLWLSDGMRARLRQA